MSAKISIIGHTYGKLKVIAEVPEIRSPKGTSIRRVLCVCACGVQKMIRVDSLRSGGTKSCGCIQRDAQHRTFFKHGHAKLKNQSHTYQVWSQMIQRCLTPSNKSFKNYGGRGITVCERWKDFKNFVSDMGEKPSDLCLDRIDNDGNYELGNCRWTTRKQQNRNTRSNRIFTINGVTGCMAELCEHFAISIQTVSVRINGLGWKPESAFLTPVKKRSSF